MAGGKRGEISGAGAGAGTPEAEQTVPWVRQSNFWVAACRSNKCLSKPVVLRVLGQPVKLNARVASRSGALELWDWTNGRAEHMVLQNIARRRGRSILASISRSSWTFNHWNPPGNACPVPVCVRVRVLVLVRLPVPVAGIREEPRSKAQRSSRRGPSPTLQAEQGSGQVRSRQVRSKTSLPKFERGRVCEEMAGARSTRASDGTRCRSYCRRDGVGSSSL